MANVVITIRFKEIEISSDGSKVPPFSADLRELRPNQKRNIAPPHVAISESSGLVATAVPTPAIPMTIRVASHRMQMAAITRG